MATHLRRTHPQNAKRLVSQFTISDKEKMLMKAKWDSIQKVLNTHCRSKKSKGKKVFMISDAHSSRLILE